MKNENKTNEKETVADRLLKLYYHLFFLLVLFVALIVRDGYYDLMPTKAYAFLYGSSFLLPFSVFALVIKKKRGYKLFAEKHDIFIFFLLLSAFISTVSSYDVRSALIGDQGWYIGLLTIFLLIVHYFSLKDLPFEDKWIGKMAMAIVFFEFALFILGSTRLNVLGFKTDFSEREFFNYYGTIGHNNWCVGFLSLLVPPTVILYIGSNDKIYTIFFFFFSLFGIISSVLIGAEGIYLAYGVGFLFVLPFFLKNLSHINRLSVLLFSSSISFFIIRVCPLFEDRLDRINGIGRFFFDFKNIIILFTISLILYSYGSSVKEKKYLQRRKHIILLSKAVVICLFVTISICLVSSAGRDFGNGRIPLWELSLKTYINRFPLKMKLFGIGPELLNNIYAVLTDETKAAYICSHSEPIQMLLTMGLLGFISWAMAWIFLIKRCFEMESCNRYLATALIASFSSYLAQTLVNSSTTLNLLILTMIAILFSQIKNSKKDRR